MIKKRLKKMTIALLCVALGISTLTPMDDTNAATIVYTRKKNYILSDSAKIKRFICNATKRNYNPALKKVSMTFTDEGKYTIKYVTGKNKKKTCVVYIDSKKPVVSGVKNGEDYESKVSIKVSDKVSGVASVTLNGKKMGNKFTVSEAGDYKLVAKDKCNNKTVVNFCVIEDEPEETPVVVTAEPNPEDFETPSPEPTEDSNGGTVVIGGTSTPVAISATTTDAPKGTATPKVKTTASPTPTAKETEKPETAIATPKVTSTPTVVPTEVPLTPTPTKKVTASPAPTPTAVLDDKEFLNQNWEYSISNSTITLTKYKGTATDVVINGSYNVGGVYYTTKIEKSIEKSGSFSSSREIIGPFVGNQTITSVTFKSDTIVEDVNYLFFGCTKLKTVEGLGSNFRAMNYTFYMCYSFNQKMTIPDGVVEMCNTFEGCEALTEMPVFGPASKCHRMNGTYKRCTGLKSNVFVLPDNVENIDYCFSGCTGMTAWAVIPDTVKSANYAFANCTSIKYVYMNNQGSALENASHMFENCINLDTAFIAITSKTKDISYMFYSNRSRSTVINVFGYTGPEGINLDTAFTDCTGSIACSSGILSAWSYARSNNKWSNVSFEMKTS